MTDSTVIAPRFSVVIPNWNGMALMRPCLDSLSQQTWQDFEVIVADNGSTDGSVQALAQEYPQVRVLALDHNGGYSGGSNAGIRAAHGEILVMLNNDTEADPRWLEQLNLAFERHPDAGAVASRMMIFRQREILNSAGDLFGRNGMPNSRGVWQPYGPPYDQEAMVFGGCGGALALRRAMLDEIGLFEERFFMYCEDVDLAWRAQLAGYTCVYTPDAVIYHHLSATGGGTLASYYVGRNTLWVIARNMPGGLIKKHWRAIAGAQWQIAREALRAWHGEAARARLRGQIVGLFTSVKWLGTRHATLQKRRVGDDAIDSILE